MAEAHLRELIEFIARGLVDAPDEVDVQEFDEGDQVVYELHVHPDDMGKVIGKNGRMARAIRALVSAAGDRNGVHAVLDIVD